MGTRSIVLIWAVCAVAVALSAADNAFMGTWKLNEAKSKIPAGAAKNTTVVYSPAGDETKVTTDGVDGSGNPSHSEWTGKFDGKPYPVTGMSSIDSRSVTPKGDRILDMANIKNGKTVGTGKTEVAKDGKSRTLESDGTLPDGKEYHAKYVFDKQ